MDHISRIHTIHTLGPKGTNCEAAATHWLSQHNKKADICLHETLEDAVLKMGSISNSALLSCIVYPDLHHLVFRNLDRLQLVDAFIMPTIPMVLASVTSFERPATVASHPAPVDLIPEWIADRRFVTSNSAAAKACRDGLVESCITTERAAMAYDLRILLNFGEIPMGFAVHSQLPARPADAQ